MIISELSRIIDHIICLGILGVDLGAFASFLYMFHKREDIYQILEKDDGRAPDEHFLPGRRS
jgi:NADH-quinone oxidoreductase subunit D